MKTLPPKWYEYAEKSTSPGERIVKNYSGKLDGKYGYLLITDKKIFFVQEEGFIRKNYSTPLILSFDKIKDVEPIDNYHLRIFEKTGKTYEFSSDVSTSRIKEGMQEVMH